jgi:DNA invertase Pin-like site-specific DNA recombinase
MSTWRSRAAGGPIGQSWRKHWRCVGRTVQRWWLPRSTAWLQSFLSRILEAGVEVRFCDLPQIEGPTGRFLLQSMMAVAELEAGMISARTKAALAASKARGKKLGGFRGRAGTAKDTARARAARTLKATQQARSIAPIIDRVDPDRTASLRGIARALNDEGVPTPSGEGTWTAATVARLRQRLELS